MKIHNTAIIKRHGKEDITLYNNMFKSVYKKSFLLQEFTKNMYFSTSSAVAVCVNSSTTDDLFKVTEATISYPLILTDYNFDVSKGEVFATLKVCIPVTDSVTFRSFGFMESIDNATHEAYVYSQFIYSTDIPFIKAVNEDLEILVTIKLKEVKENTSFDFVAGDNEMLRGLLGCISGGGDLNKFEVADADDLRPCGAGSKPVHRPLKVFNYKKPIVPTYDAKLKKLTFSLMPDTFDKDFKVHEIVLVYNGKAVFRKPLHKLQGLKLEAENAFVRMGSKIHLRFECDTVDSVRDYSDDMKTYDFTINKEATMISDFCYEPFEGVEKLATKRIVSTCQTKIMFFVGKKIIVFKEENQEFIRLNSSLCDPSSVIKTFFFDNFIIFMKGDKYGKLYFDLYELINDKYEKKIIAIDELYNDKEFSGFDIDRVDASTPNKEIDFLQIDIIHTYFTTMQEFRIGFIGKSKLGSNGVMKIVRCKKHADGNYFFDSITEIPKIDNVAFIGGCKSDKYQDYGFICFGESSYSTDTTNHVQCVMIDADDNMTVRYNQVAGRGFNKVMPLIKKGYGLIANMAVVMMKNYFFIPYLTPKVFQINRNSPIGFFDYKFYSENDTYYMHINIQDNFILFGRTMNYSDKEPFINMSILNISMFSPASDIDELIILGNNAILLYKSLERPAMHMRLCENVCYLTNVNAPVDTRVKVYSKMYYSYDQYQSNLNRRFYLVIEGTNV
ncbi:MAG: hypothetical protein RR334_02125 [Clostridia bacterium]